MRSRILRGDRPGAAAVEFALVLPLLIVMLFGIIEFGRAWHRQQVITDAAREGARWAVVRDGLDKDATVTTAIQNRLTVTGLTWDGTVSSYAATCDGWAAPTGAADDVMVAGCGWGADSGSEARVVIRAPYPFDFLRPVIGLLGGSGSVDAVVLSTNFVMRNE
ncbi:MAG TPA: TadE family protein [Longimicrobiales bacterium]|nr:TadE family protein [Longimicrobiales bacterium]